MKDQDTASVKEPNVAELTELNEILTSALDTMDSAFVILKDHVCVFENTGFRKILGVDDDFTLLGKNDDDLFNVIFSLKKTSRKEVNEEIRANLKAMVTKNIREKIPFSDEILLGDGRWVKSSSWPWRDNGRVLTFSDITQLKIAQLKAESADKAKSDFLANMSHEIRTPMNGIMGMSQLLANCELGTREREFVQTIDRSGQALISITNDILDFSKIEAGHAELDIQPFLLRDCLEDVTTLLSTAAIETGIDLLLRIAPNVSTTFLGDVGRVRQMVTNLVGNALKFTHQGHVLIDVTAAAVTNKVAELTIAISDTGIGIAKDKLSAVFEKFNQADGSTTREYEGTGLGLTIANNLAHLMNGSIAVESELGEGSTFTLKIELGVTKDATLSPPQTLPSISGNILLIDDIVANHDILKEQLSSETCKCISVNSAKKGLAVLDKARKKNIPIDLIIVDYQMPEMTGDEFIRIVKIQNAYKHIPVILFSSVNNDRLKRELKVFGVEGYLTKPARYNDLIRTISSAMAQSAKPDESAGLPPQNIAQDAVSKPAITKAGQLDVLIAEDNDVNQMFIKYIMEDMGVSFQIVPSGRLAFEKWKLRSPKIIFMDISMPDWNGYEATKAIRDWEAKLGRPRTPIVAVTAHALKGDRQDCLGHDMDDYLSKPLAISRLKEMMEKWTDMTELPDISKAS